MSTSAPLTGALRRLATNASRQARPMQITTRSYQTQFPLVASRQPLMKLVNRRIQWPQARSFSVTAATAHGHLEAPKPGEELWVTFIDKDGDEHKIGVCEGDNLLDIAQDNDLEMEADEAHYDQMEEPDDDENDMLDLAFGLTETSRLGCQVKMTKALDGLTVRLPTMTRNLQASDFS
ncbi:hypothetical protein ACHAQH_002355 [Verticillium albo-atrum]